MAKVLDAQANAFLKDLGFPIAESFVVFSPGEAVDRARVLGGTFWLLSGTDRYGKRCTRVAKDFDDVRALSEELFEKADRKVFVQSYFETNFKYRAGFSMDFRKKQIFLTVETLGDGKSTNTLYAPVQTLEGWRLFQGRALAFGLGLRGKQVSELAGLLKHLYSVFVDFDLKELFLDAMIWSEEKWTVLSSTLNVDTLALFRQKRMEDWVAWRGPSTPSTETLETFKGTVGVFSTSRLCGLGVWDALLADGLDAAHLVCAGEAECSNEDLLKKLFNAPQSTAFFLDFETIPESCLPLACALKTVLQQTVRLGLCVVRWSGKDEEEAQALLCNKNIVHVSSVEEGVRVLKKELMEEEEGVHDVAV